MWLKGLRLHDDLSFNFISERWFGEIGKEVRKLLKENNDLQNNYGLFEQSGQSWHWKNVYFSH